MKIHMIAICGTGMGSLAGLLKAKGHEVTGSDNNIYPPMSDQLASLSIPVLSGFHPDHINQTKPDLVIIGNAVSKNNPEVEEVEKQKLSRYSMPEAIEHLFLGEKFSIVVSGTHGKTTTSALLSWILEATGQSPSFLVGGILKNFSGSCQLGHGDYFVLEGDEYDSAFFDKKAKFLHYKPQMLIINPVEFDHADIYRDLDHILEAFAELVELVPPTGVILAAGDSENVRKLVSKAKSRVITFGTKSHNALLAKNISLEGKTSFEVFQENRLLGVIESPLLGIHNIQNTLAVLGIALELGIPFSEFQKALSQFQGVKRRQEILATLKGITLIDDFAHHPTAVRETLAAIRPRYQGKIWALFEPRSNTTRRKVFQKDFVSSFDLADEIIIAAPYLIEKIPVEQRLSPEQLVDDLKKHGKNARYFSEIETIVKTVSNEAQKGDVICFMSNGGFGGIYQKMLLSLS